MIIFKRTIETRILNSLFKGRMVSILGPRQSGKTTLAKKIIKGYGKDAAYYDCQLAEVRQHFIVGKPDELLPLTIGKKVVVFDEAQTIQDIGTILKVFHDKNPGVQIIATGSSSFDLANKINEPMTGRIFEFILLPLSLLEISKSKHISARDLHQYMLYGTYPAIVGERSLDIKKTILKNIATQYLYKDVFTFEAIRNPRVFEDLLKLLALQIGSLVSLNELAIHLGVSRSVIQRYLRLLEQSFIIKIVHSFSNNPRTELKKAFKVFFLDTGVRNALVDISSPMDKRNDKGSIFENFFVSERLKIGTLEIFPPEIMFWRTRIGQEIDVIEKKGIEIFAYECKWKEKITIPRTFETLYPNAHFECVTTENILSSYLNKLPQKFHCR
ncbi:ATP-binding protein [Candidatus Peregrinibacteria bacterium]|nr:ATP-binding protein [Candidatus Peregrinibacteria bacterium]